MIQNMKFIATLKWIEQRRVEFGLIGAILLLVAIGLGVWWAAGADVEPFAFLFITGSSIFFGIPYAVEALLPKRQLIRDMTTAEKLVLIERSHASDDWTHIYPERQSREYYHRQDSQLRIAMRFDEDGVQCEDYREAWANCYPDPKATGYWANVTYAGQVVERIVLVAVDGGRAELPAPRPNSLFVPRLNFKVAQINDIIGLLDEHMRSSGLSLDP